MRSCLNLSLVLIFVAVFVTETAHANPVPNVDKSFIDVICKASTNPQFCLDLLNSDPRSAGASVPDLAQNTLEKAKSSAVDAINIIQTLLKSTTDPTLKGNYQSCTAKFNDATSNLDKAKVAVGSKNLADLTESLSAARNDVTTCGDGFTGEPQQLKDASQKVGNIIGIVFAISDNL